MAYSTPKSVADAQEKPAALLHDQGKNLEEAQRTKEVGLTGPATELWLTGHWGLDFARNGLVFVGNSVKTSVLQFSVLAEAKRVRPCDQVRAQTHAPNVWHGVADIFASPELP